MHRQRATRVGCLEEEEEEEEEEGSKLRRRRRRRSSSSRKVYSKLTQLEEARAAIPLGPVIRNGQTKLRLAYGLGSASVHSSVSMLSSQGSRRGGVRGY